MNILILSFYILSIFSYFLLLILPTQNQFLFSAFVLCVISFLIYKKFSSLVAVARNIPISYYVILIVYIVIGVYGMYLRWVAEPYGMWDAWAIWNLKAKSITNEFLFGNGINFANEYWPHRDYPLGLPIFNSSLAILFGGWSEWITYGVQILFYIIIGFIFLLYSHSKKLHFIYLIFPLFILSMNSEILIIASDLCAEMALSCFLIIIYYTLIGESEKEDITGYSVLHYGMIFAAPLLIKNEGAVYTGLILFLYLVFHFFKGKNKLSFVKLCFYVLLPSLLIAILLIFWKYQGDQLTPDDFQGNTGQLLNSEMVLTKLKLVYTYFLNFQFSKMNGLFFVMIVLGFIVNNLNHRLVSLHMLCILIIYNLLFLFSSKDLSWHLENSYIRIHSPLIAPVIFLGWSSVVVLLNNKSKSDSKT